MHFPELLVALSGTFFLFGWPMIWMVCHYIYQCVKVSREVALKRDMVARGYTAQEIVMVVAAKKGSQPTKTMDVPPAKPIRHPALV